MEMGLLIKNMTKNRFLFFKLKIEKALVDN